MKTKIQIKSISGSILFEHEKEDNSVKDTLTEAVKKGSDLQGSDLRDANLQGSDLQDADLRDAYLLGANLRGADLRGSDLQDADLRGAYLLGANLQGSDLRGADLRGAYLQGSDLRGSDLRDADLRDAYLKKIVAYNSLLPEGELIVWKKLRNDLLAMLKIPAGAKRVNAIGSRKCRFEYAEVMAIYDGKKKVKTGYSRNTITFIYKVGEIVMPDSFDDSPLIECSNGIHAFITRLEAEEY